MSHSPTPSTDSADATAASRESRATAAHAKYSTSLVVWIIKIALLGLADAFCIYATLAAFSHHSHWIAAGFIVLALVVTVVFLPPNRFLPAKYLTPGLIFLLVFTVGMAAYTAYVAFTNYGDGHNGSKTDAINSIIANNQDRVPNSPQYAAGVATKDGQPASKLWLVVQDPKNKKFYAGSPSDPLAEISNVQMDSLGDIKSAQGFHVLPFADVSKRSSEVSALSVPFSANPADGYLRTTTGDQAFVFKSTWKYDKASDTFTDSKGNVYTNNGKGSFVSKDGKIVQPGWKVGVGFHNFSRALTDKSIRGPLGQVIWWTFAYAILSVLTTFALGLFLAIMLNDRRMRGQKIYRSIMILPYAFPGFLSALVWGGLFNRQFGFINQVLLRGADIPWLTDAWWAKLAILLLNLWLGFPYMFLLCTGALQSIPEELQEAARMDGASPWQTFLRIKLPLLMVPLAPLLISSFAFNFNNFVVIYLLTGGGPQMQGTSLNVGSTDILISMVFKAAGFGGGAHDYGLASAFSIIIFFVVGIISYFGFRQTRQLENLA